MINNQTTKFSGVLSQHEFAERYIFIMQRIANGFSREDVAFLLGRTSYHVNDYEALSDKVKMDYEDHEVMPVLFKTPAPSAPAFNTKVNNLDISNEKRMIRGTLTEKERELNCQFIHPWIIKGINTPVRINAGIPQRNTAYDEEIKHYLSAQFTGLMNAGYFSCKSSAIAIYHLLFRGICFCFSVLNICELLMF